ncbi:hypothetical protein MGYG_09194 [Nannizzia gypsea CBS 118893]|uniref:Uncharacterized protein n=1 Tax=Arthroderma gypseum (strain ATCC MYA-4604 / CBS 118893) TaxID=535722 RepID=E4V667_ARTGP|nr:hypothetical protein MGYG_09194 [Nannizzia gypsea CBS 118893]EFR05250.1 hypothetical protein MGYG_09194 [Nannizzia gypsea CBS 118893]
MAWTSYTLTWLAFALFSPSLAHHMEPFEKPPIMNLDGKKLQLSRVLEASSDINLCTPSICTLDTRHAVAHLISLHPLLPADAARMKMLDGSL